MNINRQFIYTDLTTKGKIHVVRHHFITLFFRKAKKFKQLIVPFANVKKTVKEEAVNSSGAPNAYKNVESTTL